MAVVVQVFGRRRHREPLGTLGEPASKKRRGTKSRGVWGRVGGQRYGDLIFAPIMMVGAKLARGGLDRVRRGSWKRAMGISVVAWGVSTGGRIVDWRGLCREGSPPAWSQRNGTGKRRRSQAVWLMTCRSWSGSAATSARSRVRTPRSRSCGRRNAGMGRAARAAPPARYPTAVADRRQAGRHRGSARAVAMFSARLALAKSP